MFCCSTGCIGAYGSDPKDDEAFSADENFDARFDVNFVISHDGSVLQTPPAIIKVTKP